MVSSSEGNTKPTEKWRDESISDLEAAKLLLDVWKFRQTHCWKSLQTFWLAAVTVSIAPYLLTEDHARRFGQWLVVLPILGMMIALAAVWLYAAEYVRCQPYNSRFREILTLRDYCEPMRLPPFRQWLLVDWKIGWTTIVLLFAMSVVLPLINVFIVYYVVI